MSSGLPKSIIWLAWLLLTAGLAGYYGYTMFAAEDKSEFLVGEATHGHHQIEMACSTCHVEPFGGPELIHDACLTCHKDELDEANDSHPIKKFTDPRNADRVEILDARNCVTCHNEHQLEQTNAMGVTLPDDYCFFCHQDIGEDRPSHQGMEFDTCASAGCHNYHDNLALYENFLLKHQQGTAIDWKARIMPTDLTLQIPTNDSLTAEQADAKQGEQNIAHDWAASEHAAAGVNCTDCHQAKGAEWEDKPAVEACQSCHKVEAEGFLAGKHGMRLKAGLSPMTPAQGRLDFHPETAHAELSCSSCHDPHKPDLQVAAVEACVGCHNDEHTQAYDGSPHAALWQKELSGSAEAGSGVTCATCHMPRIEFEVYGESFVGVQHNQNANLRPNEKMIRSSCMNCHSLAFSIDALADPELILKNFRGKPGAHIPSIDMAVERDQ